MIRKHPVGWVWHKTALILLTLHGLYGLWESFFFLFWELPRLNRELAAHAITAREVNFIIASALVLMTSTFVSFFLALRLFRTNKIWAEVLDLIVASVFLIGGTFLSHLLLQFSPLEWLATLLTEIFTSTP